MEKASNTRGLDRIKMLDLVEIVSDESVPELVILKLKSDLTVATTGRYRDAFQHFVGGACRQLELDLGSVTFIDSSGIGLLAGTHKDLVAKGGELRLIAPSPLVRNILKIVRFDQRVVIR